MSIRPITLAAAAAAAAAVACAATVDAAAGAPTFYRHSCAEQLNAPQGTRCGLVVVFEDRGRAAGTTIGLNVMVLPATGGPAASDAVFGIAGGPGRPAADASGFDFAALAGAAHATRDVVLVDQRGTGGSHPLQCEIYPGADQTRYFGPLWPADVFDRCAQRLGAIADLSHYGTTDAADDLDDVRSALGYDKVDLLGVAYGSTVALAYLRRHPDRARTAVLEGAAAADAKVPLGVARAAQHAVDALFADCSADATCRAAAPNIRTEFSSVLTTLGKGPVAARVTDPLTKAKLPVQIDLPTWVSTVRFALDDAARTSALLEIIHAAAHGDFDPSADLTAGIRGGLAGSFWGMTMSVACAEEIAPIDPASIPAATRGTFLGDVGLRAQMAACDVWPHAVVDPSFFTPVRANVPVLLLTGALDPTTTPEEASHVQRFLPHAVDVVFPHVAHAARTACGEKLTGAFIVAGGGAGLDASCAAQESRPPFRS